MRAVRILTPEEQDLATQYHHLVGEFLKFKCLPEDEFYDVVIFGYLCAVQQYVRKPPANVGFRTMAIRAMKDALYKDGVYRSRAKRMGLVTSLDEMVPDEREALWDPRQDVQEQIEYRTILEQVVSLATPTESPIVRMLMDGSTLTDAARKLHVSHPTVKKRMKAFYARARTAVA